MEYKSFIGINISKKTIDVAIKTKNVKELLHKQFENKKTGFTSMLKWIKQVTKTT